MKLDQQSGLLQTTFTMPLLFLDLYEPQTGWLLPAESIDPIAGVVENGGDSCFPTVPIAELIL